MEIPYPGKAIIDERFDGIEITVPPKKNTFQIAFLSIWLCAWFAGEIFVLPSLLAGGNSGFPMPFAILWIAGWTVGGLFAIRTWLWNVIGKEIITIGQGTLVIQKKWALLYKPKTYDLAEAKNFRAEEEIINTNIVGADRSNPWKLDDKGTIKFDYGMKTIKFGDGLYEAEANAIIEKLRSKKLIK
ncbi:hypothetical protein HDF24_02130 [Mucilaginibacter sp. X4EP1]|uniref:hypothetical protein n=1 Tax=Mucilaginibacter sp. X4EP1 TaxID=2723092 RepID=UPI002166FAE0|nr:hypothetical protein [Mucilaginibacter sp. X4EP1]MCS3811814.1 hypothetical protein [Mucilaginibacter sp. X4EP1]